jgi:hypothetical protein
MRAKRPPLSGERAMSDMPDRRPVRAHWIRWILVIPFIAVLWVPFFDSVQPSAFGVPFFYWYQLAWVLISGVIIGAVYLVEHRG